MVITEPTSKGREERKGEEERERFEEGRTIGIECPAPVLLNVLLEEKGFLFSLPPSLPLFHTRSPTSGAHTTGEK